ncbi:preprotein translocase subunit SecG [Proteiniborus ethanoligenes]|uniref:Protein-export membrane protein SecG n=1 Tax=Proteiniborus ethanoligenes TaxID=415015 RepID=A0A1H3RNS8_9FIRM|nr:preprotein translocase subunit SecG [Proteiniborus ethanoligenes]TAH63225.1 MAG: preprotein translocase subunit SecG [Gottschalkiaceae bacterium]SDZ26888.1 preprotein translocase subunit SecG [Proteiniborus ethanoligenes]
MTILFYILIVIASLALIASILLQSGKSAGLSGSIGGGAESIWGKSKGRSYEGILSKVTTVSAIVFVISALVLTALQ